MKARLTYDGHLWYGEVNGTYRNHSTGNSLSGWERVTSGSLTKLGAKLELAMWKRENISKEFDI